MTETVLRQFIVAANTEKTAMKLVDLMASAFSASFEMIQSVNAPDEWHVWLVRANKRKIGVRDWDRMAYYAIGAKAVLEGGCLER